MIGRDILGVLIIVAIICFILWILVEIASAVSTAEEMKKECKEQNSHHKYIPPLKHIGSGLYVPNEIIPEKTRLELMRTIKECEIIVDNCKNIISQKQSKKAQKHDTIN